MTRPEKRIPRPDVPRAFASAAETLADDARRRLHRRLDKRRERVDVALLRRVLRHRAVLADHVDGREALDAKLARDELALLVATVLGDGDRVAQLVGELLVLLHHTLAELAPRRVDPH